MGSPRNEQTVEIATEQIIARVLGISLSTSV